MVMNSFGDILGLGTPELILILVILVLLFGASKLPQLSRSLGSSMKELRKGLRDEDDEKRSASTSTGKQS